MPDGERLMVGGWGKGIVEPGLESDRQALAQLRRDVQDLLKESRLQAGDRIPPESELAARFRVSQEDIRRALTLLEQDGVVDVYADGGRIALTARPVASRPVTRLESFGQMFELLGYRLEHRVVAITIEPANPEQASGLGLAEDEGLVHLRRLHLQEGRAVILSEDVFSTDLLGGKTPDEHDFNQPMSAFFLARDHAFVASATDLEAVRRPSWADLPGVDAAEPWLLITERIVDQHGALVLYTINHYRGDAFGFHVLRRWPWIGALTGRPTSGDASAQAEQSLPSLRG
jgi:GntR family transcriptional regulator